MEKIIILVCLFTVVFMALLAYAGYVSDKWKLFDAEQNETAKKQFKL